VDPLDAARRYFAERSVPAWLVGGRVRDALLGRTSLDSDVVVGRDAAAHARALARRTGGSFVLLDPRRGYARVVWSGDAETVLDITDIQGDGLEADLMARDFTVNALAVRLGVALPPDRSQVIDPTGGLLDLAAGRLRATSPAAFDADPLRLLRGVRLAATLGLALDPATREAMTSRAPLAAQPAGERVREELARMLATGAPGDAVAELGRLGLLEVVLPATLPGLEVAAEALSALSAWRSTAGERGDGQVGAWLDDDAHGVADVGGAADVERLSAAPPPAISRHGAAIAAREPRPAVGGHGADVWTNLALLLAAGALAAPARSPRPARRVRAAVDAAALRLRLGIAETGRVYATARLAVGLCAPSAHDRSTRRAVYRAFRLGGECAAEAAIVAVALAWAAERLHARTAPFETSSGAASARPLDAVQMDAGAWLDAWFWHRAERIDPPMLLDGRALMAALDLAPGPIVGRLLAGLREAQALGEVVTVRDAEAWAKARLAAYG